MSAFIAPVEVPLTLIAKSFFFTSYFFASMIEGIFLAKKRAAMAMLRITAPNENLLWKVMAGRYRIWPYFPYIQTC